MTKFKSWIKRFELCPVKPTKRKTKAFRLGFFFSLRSVSPLYLPVSARLFSFSLVYAKRFQLLVRMLNSLTNVSLNMLSEIEYDNIFNWLPYRDTWPIDRNRVNDNISTYYGSLRSDIVGSSVFTAEQTQDGGMSNYLEFICYPKGSGFYSGPAIMLCISLCAPVASYGEVEFTKAHNYSGLSGFIEPESVGVVTQHMLIPVRANIVEILKKHEIDIIDSLLSCKPLPSAIIASMENLNFGNQYLHGLFQCTD